MNSIYTTSLRTEPAQNLHSRYLKNPSIPQPISESYKDLFLTHLLAIQQRQQTNKQNTFNSKKIPKRKNKYASIGQNLILSQIQPQIGSLNQFIYSPQQNRFIYTSKKKRNEQAIEQNIFKKKILQKNSEENILRSSQSSNYEKKIASKVLVERIFNQVYNSPVQQFVAKNSLKKTSQSLLNISTLESLLSTDRVSVLSQKNNSSQNRQFEQSVKIYQERKTGGKRTVGIRFDNELKLEKINQLKSNYPNLKKLPIPQKNTDFALLIEAQNKLDNYIKQLSDYINISQRGSMILNAARKSLLDKNVISAPQMVDVKQCMIDVSEKFKISKQKTVVSAQTIAKVTDDKISFQKIQFKDLDMGLYMIGSIKLQRIKIVRLEHISIDQNILFLLLDVLCKFAPQTKPMKQVSICSISIEDLMTFSMKMSQLLREINIKRLCLNCIDIGSKELARICAGIGENENLQELQIKDNRISSMGLKHVEAMLKMNKNIISVDLRGNDFSNIFNCKQRDQRIIFDEHDE